MLRLLLASLIVSAFAACSLDERADFLIGRSCDVTTQASCDEGQRCLPHAIIEGTHDDFRCRDAASFEVIEGREPPLAYCDESLGFVCPEGLDCNADRIRSGAPTLRYKVCQQPGSPFAPPPDETSG